MCACGVVDGTRIAMRILASLLRLLSRVHVEAAVCMYMYTVLYSPGCQFSKAYLNVLSIVPTHIDLGEKLRSASYAFGAVSCELCPTRLISWYVYLE